MNLNGIGIAADDTRINGDLGVFREMLDLYTEIGFDYVEIASSGFDVITNGELKYSQVKKVKKILSDYNFKYTMHAGPDALNLFSHDNERHYKVLKSSVDFASEVGSEILVYHGGTALLTEQYINYHRDLFNVESKEEIFTKLVDREISQLKALAEYAKPLGVTLSLENLDRRSSENYFTYSDKCEKIIDVIEAIDMENISFTFDFAHAYLIDRDNFIENTYKASKFAAHLHITDNFGITGDYGNTNANIAFGTGDLHLPPGHGKIPYAEVMPFFNNFDGAIILEIDHRYREYYNESLLKIKKLMGLRG